MVTTVHDGIPYYTDGTGPRAWAFTYDLAPGAVSTITELPPNTYNFEAWCGDGRVTFSVFRGDVLLAERSLSRLGGLLGGEDLVDFDQIVLTCVDVRATGTLRFSADAPAEADTPILVGV